MAARVGGGVTFAHDAKQEDGKVLTTSRQEEGEVNVVVARDPTDGELMNAMAQGDLQSLSRLYQRHQATIRDLLLRVDPDRSHADADDLCQEVFLTLFETSSRYHGGDRLRPWLIGIALHKARRFRQKWRLRRWLLFRRETPKALTIDNDLQLSPDTLLAQRKQMTQAFAALKPQQREILALHVGEHLRGEEIASLLGIELKTVWTRLHRAREALRQALGDSL
jgi:RNA polymerase sigma-70 factor, ECF subfamily